MYIYIYIYIYIISYPQTNVDPKNFHPSWIRHRTVQLKGQVIQDGLVDDLGTRAKTMLKWTV